VWQKRRKDKNGKLIRNRNMNKPNLWRKKKAECKGLAELRRDVNGRA